MAEFQITNTSPFTVADNTSSVTASLTLRNGDQTVSLSATQVRISEELILNDPFGGEDRMVIDAGFAFGRNQARLNLSGTGTPNSFIECEDNTTGIWNVIATVQSDGRWQSDDGAATVTVPSNYDLSGDWYKVRIRSQGGDGTIVESTNTFLPGLVFASVSQSELAQLFGNKANIWNNDEIPLQNENNFQLLQYRKNYGGPAQGSAYLDPSEWTVERDETGAVVDAHWTGFPERTFVNSSSTDGGNAYLRHLANIFNQRMSNIPILFVSLNWAGTSRLSLIQERVMVPTGNNITDRDWLHDAHAVQWCRDRGTEIGIITEMWFASDLSSPFITKFGPLYSKVKYSVDASTAPYSTGGQTADYILGESYDTIPFSGGGVVECYHCWFDASTGVADNELGDGILRKDSTKYAILGPNWFFDPNVPAGILGSTTLPTDSGDPTHPNAPDRTYKNAVIKYAEAAGDSETYGTIDYTATSFSRMKSGFALRKAVMLLTESDHNKSFMTPMGIDTNVVSHGEWQIDGDSDDIIEAWGDLSHPSGNTVRGTGLPQDDQQRAIDGIMLYWEYNIIETLKVAGFIDYPIPMFVPVETHPDGDYVILEVQNYNGGELPVGSRLENIRSVRDESQLVRDTFSDASIENGDNVTYNELMGFDILRAGGDPVGDATYEGFDVKFDRTANNLRVKITPDVPFSSGDTIWYNRGTSNGWTRNQRDITNKVYASSPILVVPGLFSEEKLEGIPVAAYPRSQEIVIGL